MKSGAIIITVATTDRKKKDQGSMKSGDRHAALSDRDLIELEIFSASASFHPTHEPIYQVCNLLIQENAVCFELNLFECW
jgi:hypothetical protein